MIREQATRTRRRPGRAESSAAFAASDGLRGRRCQDSRGAAGTAGAGGCVFIPAGRLRARGDDGLLRSHRRGNIHLYPDDWKELPITVALSMAYMAA